MRLPIAGALLVLGTTVLSCSTFPTAQVSVDFTRETVPVMVSAAPSDAAGKNLDFEAGYRSQSMSTSRTSGGVTTTMSMSGSMLQNKPLAAQLRNTLIQTPSRLQVTGLQFRNAYFMLFLVGSIETTEYTTHLEINLPTGDLK